MENKVVDLPPGHGRHADELAPPFKGLYVPTGHAVDVALDDPCGQ